MADFTYVLIPADPSQDIQEHVGDGSGGLENCKLTAHAREYFSNDVKVPTTPEEKRAMAAAMRQQALDSGLPEEQLGSLTDDMLVSYATSQTNNCEITALTLPVARSNHRAVSCYSDRNAVQKQLRVNSRATAMAHACGHTSAELRGDCFLSRYHDNENANIWRRVDLKVADVAVNASWCTAARKKGGGGGHGGAGSSLGGLMEKFANDRGKANGMAMEEKTQDGQQAYTWTQDAEDVEITLTVPEDTSSRSVRVTFGMSSLVVAVAGAELISGRTGGHVAVDDSTWTLQGSGDSRQLCITLNKLREGTTWDQLLQ